jgi:GTP-binding protein Era
MPKPKAPAPRKARASRGPDRSQRPNTRPEPRKGGTKPGGPREGGPRQDDARRDRPRKDDPRKGAPRQDDARRDRPRKDDPRKGGPRQDDARRDRPRKDDPRKGGPRQDDARRDRPRKDDPRKGAPRKNGTGHATSARNGRPREDERRSATARAGGPRGEAKPRESARHDEPREDARKGSARSPRPRPAPSRKVPRALRERETIDTPSARPGGAVVRPAVGALASATKSSTGSTDALAATRPARSGTVAIIGRPNVGKSTLLNAALEVPLAIVTPAPQTTRETLLGVVHRIVDGSPCELALLDTPGLHKAERALDHRMNRAARDAASGADVVVFVADASGAVEHTGVHPGDAALLGDLGAGSRAVLVLNKIDRV